MFYVETRWRTVLSSEDDEQQGPRNTEPQERVTPMQAEMPFSADPRRDAISRTKTESRTTEKLNLRRTRLAMLFSELMEPRYRTAIGLAEMLSLFLFCALLIWAIPHHESWFDETQAWLIARSSTLTDIVVHRLHYEGAPALWHILLWIEFHLHVSFLGMRWIAGAIAAAGMYLWLRYNPLPRLISLLLPLTYFFLYQYAVVARSYVLCPIFAFSPMALYQNRKSSPMLFCVLAGLFANCSLHMAAFSVGLVLMYARDRWSASNSELPGSRNLRRYLAPAAVLLALLMASAATAVPTADGSSTTANPVVGGIRKITPHAGDPAIPAAATPAATEVQAQTEPPPQSALATMIWHKVNPGPNASHKVAIQGKEIKKLLVLLTAITTPISTSNLLAGLFLVLLLICLGRAHLWIALAPYVLVQLCNTLIAGEAHHLGLVWVALICAVWALSIDPVAHKKGERAPVALYAVLLLVVLLQVG